MPAHHETQRLIPMPREQYLRQQETRIRSDSARLAPTDPAINNHLNAVLYAEELHDFHSAATDIFQQRADNHRTLRHTRLTEIAHHLKLHHLDQLAHLIL